MKLNYFKKKNRQRIRKELTEGFGQVSTKNRDISLIRESRKLYIDGPDIVDERTWNDLNMDDLFCFIDRTISKTGEQYLYSLLNKRQSPIAASNLNSKVNFYQQNFNHLISNCVTLKAYDSFSTYNLPSFIFGNQFMRIPFWTKLLGLLALFLGITSLFVTAFIHIFIISIFINTLLHYYMKRRINVFHYDFMNIKTFYRTCSLLLKFDNVPDFFSKIEIKKLKTISNNSFYLSHNIEYADELSALMYYVIEMIKGFFLFDSMLYNHTISLIESNLPLLQKAYQYIGIVDASISIASLKKGTQGCEPVISLKKELVLKNAYHPLVNNCIKNSITIKDSSIVITGSNMSGKTTFLKTIGINVILSQTINYSFCDYIENPYSNVFTSIVKEDNIEQGNSYFMDELLRANQIFKVLDSTSLPQIILFDEIFKGTNSKDRIALASALLLYLSKMNCIVIVTTHDLDIIDLVYEKYATYFFDISLVDNILYFDYKIKHGIQSKTNVLELVKSLNFPPAIISDTIKLKQTVKLPIIK